MTNCDIDYAWIQLSDLHIFDNVEWKTMQEAYKKLPYQNDIGFVIVSGDLHQYKKDYSETVKFLNNLLGFYNLSKKDIFIVPGNHDSGDCTDKEVYTHYIESEVEKNPECYRKYFVAGKLVDCFTEYSKFIKEFYGSVANVMYPEPEQVGVITWKNRMNIIHLNTAINCNGNNKLKQVIDIYKYSNLLNKLNLSCPSIIIAHHPFDSIHDSQKELLRRYITDWKVSAYLCGDTHKEAYYQIPTFASSSSNIPCIVCGKSAPETLDTYSDLSCIIYVKRKDMDKVEVLPYTWDSNKKTFSKCEKLSNDMGNLDFSLLSVKGSNTENMKKKTTNLAVGESIWLKDAEQATGSQSRFGDFTSTDIINDFLSDSSSYWGLSAVKGIGKTFVLQVKRSKISKDRICLPIGVKATPNNGWGTDTITIEEKMDLSGLRKFDNVVLLWRYCIISYVINQLINTEYYKNDKQLRYLASKLLERLEEYYKEGELEKETYILCTRDDYCNLSLVMTRILQSKNWVAVARKDVPCLAFLQRRIEEMLEYVEKKSLVILIDKVDQAMDPINAEEPVGCDICKKSNKINECANPQKSNAYCSDRSTLCRIECCYGCEKYMTPYSNTNLRVHGGNVKKYMHINIWQYLQLGLVRAVSKIKTDFKGIIEVYFTIREEAFSCETDLLGEHIRKVVNITKELWYTKDEQKQIFYDCIKCQQDEFLYNPSLKKQDDRLEEAFVGVSRLCHPYVKELDETIFDCIYRHSFDRARDIQEYGEMLTNNMQVIRNCDSVLERGEKVKKLIEDKAAELAFYDGAESSTKNGCYYVEKMNLLPNYWKDSENFKKFVMKFSKNLMFGQEAKAICKKFNDKKKCANDCSVCSAKHHPFSMMYKLGMLGRISMFHEWKNEIVQDFLHSKRVTYITGKDLINLNINTVYVLHPALTKSIEHMGKKLKHFSGFIIGKGEDVPKKILQQMYEDYKNDPKFYEEKYFYDKF